MLSNLLLIATFVVRCPISFLLEALPGSVIRRVIKSCALRRIKPSRRHDGTQTVQPSIFRYLIKYSRSKFFM
jgi:hypothetical protein